MRRATLLTLSCLVLLFALTAYGCKKPEKAPAPAPVQTTEPQPTDATGATNGEPTDPLATADPGTTDPAATPDPADTTETPDATGTTTASFDPAAVYAASCAGCHGVKGEGVTGPAYATVLHEPDAELIEVMLEGKEKMPPFRGVLDDNTAKEMLTWLRASFGTPAAT